MKKLLCLFFVMLFVMMPMALTASADTDEAIYGAELWVDVPVHSLELNGKNDVEISTAYTGATTKLAYPDPMDNVFKVASVTWYDMQNPNTPLEAGTKAQLGKTYKVSVQMAVREGFTVRTDANRHPGTKVNGQAADSFSVYTDSANQQYVLFEKTFTTIAQSFDLPEVEILEMNLIPYEGNPVEISVQVTGGTNVRYQWQLVYGASDQSSGGLNFSGVVNLADNHIYQGSRTPNFKLHSCFGDTSDEVSYFKLRCRVTTDNGTVYSQPVWYTLQDRQVISEKVYATGLSTPKAGGTPDRFVSITSAAKCRITNVEWFDNDTLMGEGEVFRKGQYRCRIHIATADAYKFDSSATVYLNGTPAQLTTVAGKDQIVQCGDTYYIERVFDVEQGEKVPGDLTEDGVVDNLDVEFLLWHTLYPEDYPITGTGDFDGNSVVDNKDVEYLLWHTLYPEDFPLILPPG